MKFSCPKCDVQLQAEPDLVGKAVKCPGCGNKLKVPGDAAAPSRPKLNVPAPTGTDAPSEQAPEEDASSPASEEQEAAIEQTENHEEYGGPRPIEYFYSGQGGNQTNVNIWLAFGIGVGIAGIWLGALWLVHTSFDEGDKPYLTTLFLERSWVQICTTLLAGWTLGILILKFLKINSQRRSMMIEALPDEISADINIHNVADFYDHVIGLPAKLHESFMFKRIRKGLEYFYVRQSNTEVASAMTAQSDIDANSIAGSYAMTKVFLWAIPIFGFIGTVLGIGAAIGDFAGALETASDPDSMVGSLQSVLGGLSSAFDTTFLALVFSILLMIPASSLQAMEDDVLNQVDEYTNDNLIKRLNDGGAGNSAALSDAGALKALGDAIAASNRDVVSKFGDVHSRMSTVYDQQNDQYEKVASAVEAQLASMQERTEKFDSRLDEEFFQNFEKVRKESTGAIDENIKILAEGIQNLNEVLKDLNGKQIVVKKRWF